MVGIVNTLQTLYDISIRDFPRDKRNIEQLRQDGLAPVRPSSTEFGGPSSHRLLQQLPLHEHAPRAAGGEDALLQCADPYYNEEVLYSKEQLRTENEDGISILFYLQKIYDDEWRNFMERMRGEGMTDDEEFGRKGTGNSVFGRHIAGRL
ncbi:Callose synthase 11 [Acorus calamus]|uniref:Callose synthase 11 n=1 Tax=Acorus calamus TaxID=4465 RepID=A0AAV9CAN1_ACOCL|nr:Callose synthase 11 [Acorus calamus]